MVEAWGILEDLLQRLRGWNHRVLPDLGLHAFEKLEKIGKRMYPIYSVIVSATTERDGRRWLHVSLTRPGGKTIPDYQDLVEVKDAFFGPNRAAYQVFPKRSEHYNAHPKCLHLWGCLDGDVLPDFRDPGGRI